MASLRYDTITIAGSAQENSVVLVRCHTFIIIDNIELHLYLVFSWGVWINETQSSWSTCSCCQRNEGEAEQESVSGQWLKLETVLNSSK